MSVTLPVLPGDSDAALAERVRAGDERAFETMVRTYAPRLARFAYDYVGSMEAAEEITDDVFLWVWEHRTTWEVRGSLRGYLFRAVRNRALNARRDAAYQTAWEIRHADDPAAAGIGGVVRDAVADLEAQELGATLRAAIDQLGEGRRTVVLLRWVQEMSYAEIAEVTGTSVVGVKQQLNRALKDLRGLLGDVVI